MHLDNMKEILNSLNTDEISTLIKLANEEKQTRDADKEKKYMDAIRRAINDYLDNVGELAFDEADSKHWTACYTHPLCG